MISRNNQCCPREQIGDSPEGSEGSQGEKGQSVTTRGAVKEGGGSGLVDGSAMRVRSGSSVFASPRQSYGAPSGRMAGPRGTRSWRSRVRK